MWTNLFDMLEAVRAHVATGGTVELDDAPEQRRLGYRDGDTVWHISLTEAKRSTVGITDPQQLATAKLFQTPEGRLQLARRDSQPSTPAFQINFYCTFYEKDGQVYAYPRTKVFVDGQQIAALDRILIESSGKQTIPRVELDQHDLPADKMPANMLKIETLRERFPWIKITMLPWEESV